MRKTALIAVATCLCAGCGSKESTSTHAAQTDATLPDPASFAARVDNPWFPLTPGTVFVYRGVKDGEPVRNVVTVTNRTKVVDGVRATVVDDRLYENGHLAERTADWYAQDKEGSVWYLGEDTAELDESGDVTTREGSWESGVDGARAGIFMPANPRVGRSFLQEYYKGHAEDRAQVLSVSTSVRVPYTSSTAALLTKEWTPLEPDVIGRKIHVRGVGLVKEVTVKGGQERTVLVSVRRP